MKQSRSILFAFLAVAVCSTVSGFAQTTQPVIGSVPRPQVPLPPGMTPIFDGQTLDGWVQVPANSWTVKDGILASLGVGRGVLYTVNRYSKYRIIFDIRHAGFAAKPDHQPCVLFFGTAPADGEKPLDALAAVRFQTHDRRAPARLIVFRLLPVCVA